ncbi:MAG: CerR family C-terminal domain-containing protein [Phycisphaerae bacterium]|nr:CerR family C-terminal domain-containing protein [Phycisphaerae bacterium]
MSKRKDGLERRTLLLDAATKVFAEKGFHNTTIHDICNEAHSNIASVNYYFRSKENLYAEVWHNAFQKALDKYPLDGGLAPNAGPVERLKALIRSHLHRMLDAGTLGHAGQILLMELANPTEAIELVKNDAISPLREHIRGIIRDLLGNEATDNKVNFCAMSIIHLCFGIGLKRGKFPAFTASMSKESLFEALVEHITLFSLGGINAVKESQDVFEKS